MQKYRKRPIVIEAVQFKGNPFDVSNALLVDEALFEQDLFDHTLTIHTLEGKMTAQIGDYIIKGVKGEVYPVKENIFQATYEKIND